MFSNCMNISEFAFLKDKLSFSHKFLGTQQYPFDIPTEAFPYEIFKQAFVAVQSCVVHLQVVVAYIATLLQIQICIWLKHNV